MLHGEHSVILSTLIKLPFVIKSIFEWPFYAGLLYHFVSNFREGFIFLCYLFVKIKPSQNSTLSFIGVGKSRHGREFLTSLFAKTIFSLNFCKFEWLAIL